MQAQVEAQVERYLPGRVDAVREMVRQEVSVESRRFFLEELARLISGEAFIRGLIQRGVNVEGRRFFGKRGAGIMRAFMTEYIDKNLDGISDGAALRVLRTRKFFDILQEQLESCQGPLDKRYPSEYLLGERKKKYCLKTERKEWG